MEWRLQVEASGRSTTCSSYVTTRSVFARGGAMAQRVVDVVYQLFAQSYVIVRVLAIARRFPTGLQESKSGQ